MEEGKDFMWAKRKQRIETSVDLEASLIDCKQSFKKSDKGFVVLKFIATDGIIFTNNRKKAHKHPFKGDLRVIESR